MYKYHKHHKNHPPNGFDHTTTSCKPCPPAPCPPPCEEVCGIFEFTGPATVFSFNTHHQFDVFFINGSERKLICTFGRENTEGCAPLVKQQDFTFCGDYEIEWCVCEDEEQPVFNISPVNPVTKTDGCGCGELFPVCLQSVIDDSPVFHGWVSAFCSDDIINVKMWNESGFNIDPTKYKRVVCC